MGDEGGRRKGGGREGPIRKREGGGKLLAFYGGGNARWWLYTGYAELGGSFLVALFTVLPLFGDWIWAPFFSSSSFPELAFYIYLVLWSVVMNVLCLMFSPCLPFCLPLKWTMNG